jgi:serine/threonine protein kinase
VDHYGRGDIVGGLGILTGEPRRAHVEAETDMDLWVMTRKQFDEMTEKDPDLLAFVTELMADRFDSRRPTAYRTIGKYVTTDIIGRGGFSIVYKGFHGVLKTPVVIKMMRHHMALYPDFFENFSNEAKTIASLDHKNIVRVYDFDERYRTLFIIMEYVKGDLLRELIDHLGAIPPRLAAHFLVQLCEALGYAHDRGIVHRDVHPSNVVVQSDNTLKILDFGLACPPGTEDVTGMGTPYYMAPEQIEGAPLDARTDVYAVGVTAFEMLTGKRPFPEESLEQLLKLHRTRDIADPKRVDPHIPEALRRFILTCGRRDPDRRYPSMAHALADLAAFSSSGGLHRRDDECESPQTTTLLLTTPDSNPAALESIVEALRGTARKLGADIAMPYPGES